MTHSSKNELPLKNALILVDIQEKIISTINNKDSIIKNIQKLLSAYQSLIKTFLSQNKTLKNWVKQSQIFYPKKVLLKFKKWILA